MGVCDEDVAESGISQPLLVFSHLTGAGDAANIHGHVASQPAWEFFLGENVGHGNSTAGFEEAVHLLEDLWLLGSRDEVDNAVGDDAVASTILKWNIGDDALNEGDVGGGVASGSLVIVGTSQHVLSGGAPLISLPLVEPEKKQVETHIIHVHANRATRRANLGRGKKHIKPCAAAKVNDGFALPQAGDGQGVATTQAEVGTFWDAGEFGFRVPKGLGDGLAVLGADAFGCSAVVLSHFVVDLGSVHFHLRMLRMGNPDEITVIVRIDDE